MSAIPEFPLKVFYDGSCSVCAAEMEVYRRKELGGRLIFIDINGPGFDPGRYGITREAFMYEMHAIDRPGRVYRGVEAFRAIWQAFPASTLYGFLGALVILPGFNSLARLAYRGFARIRKYLPKSHAACRERVCRLGNSKKEQKKEDEL
jgi:predicted DCC family thiol-disulfide oxidoreductase YuxK